MPPGCLYNRPLGDFTLAIERTVIRPKPEGQKVAFDVPALISEDLSDAKSLRQELKALRERNLKEASFKEKADLVAMLGIKFYPAEDLRSRRVACRLNLTKVAGEREQSDSVKVVFGAPNRI